LAGVAITTGLRLALPPPEEDEDDAEPPPDELFDDELLDPQAASPATSASPNRLDPSRFNLLCMWFLPIWVGRTQVEAANHRRAPDTGLRAVNCQQSAADDNLCRMNLQSRGRDGAARPAAGGPAIWRPGTRAVVPRRSLGSPLARHPRRWLAAVLVAALAVGGAVLAIDAGDSSAGRITTASVLTFKRAVVARLRAEHLTYRWVVCLPSGRGFRGVRIVRCNVDFGEPHVVAYCSVLLGGRLLTSEDDPAIPCGHDDSGYSATIMQYR
jgi:hypothetical protein